MTIKMLEWNLNFASNDATEPAAFIPDYIKGFDVAVLTEVRANKSLISMIEGMDYDVICSESRKAPSNQVVIMARKTLHLSKVAGCLKNKDEDQPDFLHGQIIADGRNIALIGVRIRSGTYKEHFKEFLQVKDYLHTETAGKSVLCAGDWNCGQIRGNPADNYAAVTDLYKYRNNSRELSDLRFYNYHLIKEMLGAGYILQEPMLEDNSWGLAEQNGELRYGLGSRIKNDLLLFSDDIQGSVNYSWQHVREHEREYLDMFLRNSRRRYGNKIDHGYPDHARLIAELQVQRSDRS